MKLRRLAALFAAISLLTLPEIVRAEPATVHGKIESLTKAGRIEVDGQLAQITPVTVITTANNQLITVHDLAVGTTVEMSVEDGPNGTDAVSIVVSILR